MSATEYVDRYLAERRGEALSVERLTVTPSGLDAEEILAVIGDTRLGQQALEVLVDLIRPDESMYYDAIYGAYHGQADIRAWLIPTMQLIDFVEFEPRASTGFFDDGAGGTSVDEWQMIAVLDGERIPLPRGVSVRRYRDGWITWNVDVYDTGPFRVPPPDPGVEAPELPPVPRTEWVTSGGADPVSLSAAATAWLDGRAALPTLADVTAPAGLDHQDLHDIVQHPVFGDDPYVLSALMHPTDSVFIDPVFGEFHGQTAIREVLTGVMGKLGNVRLDPVGPVLFNGHESVREWVQVAVLDDGTTRPMLRGTSVRRFADGWVVYAADYFDTAALAEPAFREAARAAGSTLTMADIERFRR